MINNDSKLQNKLNNVLFKISLRLNRNCKSIKKYSVTIAFRLIKQTNINFNFMKIENTKFT